MPSSPHSPPLDKLAEKAIALLRELIATPSFSREEENTAQILSGWLQREGMAYARQGNNVWSRASAWEEGKPVLLLNSHHDTVRPVDGWGRVPFDPALEDGKLYGLGSNDAGGCLVSLMAAFLHLQARKDLPVNLILAASAEEEISGANGIAALLPELPPIWAGIVGEPTQMDMAIAEKGLMVVDGEAKGKAGHAARDEGENALYIALDDIARLRDLRFEKVSPLLGPVKVSVTQIEAGRQHNVVPDSCRFVIDVRTNEAYSNREAFAILQEHCRSKLKARSFRLNSSRIDPGHPLVRSGLSLGKKTFGSPTLSDQALMDFPTLKMGPGDSARSHTADEYIRLDEIRQGIATYIELIIGLKTT